MKSNSRILNEAADWIEVEGFRQGSDAFFGTGGVCAGGAIYRARHGSYPTPERRFTAYRQVHEDPATQALLAYLEPFWRTVWEWNDCHDGQTVLAVLRACATIKAAHESAKSLVAS